GDVGVVHERQRLALGLKAGEHAPGIHSRLDQFERDAAFDRLTLFGRPHRAHSALTDDFEQAVTSGNRGPRANGRLMFSAWRYDVRWHQRADGYGGDGRSLQEGTRPVVDAKQRFNALAHLWFMRCLLIEQRGPRSGVRRLDGLKEQ